MDRMASLGGLLHSAADRRGGGGLLYCPSLLGSAIEKLDSSAESTPLCQSFPELRAEARSILGGLQSAGCRQGDLVQLALDRAQDFLPALWACLLGGFVAVPRAPLRAGKAKAIPAAGSAALPRIEGSTTWYLCQDGDAPLVGQAGEAPRMDEARSLSISTLREGPMAENLAEGSGEQTALLLATSGTTGIPRWVSLSHDNVLASITGSVQINAYTSEEISLNWLPLHHVGGLLRSLREVYLGCLQIQVPREAVVANPLVWLDLIEKHRVTMAWAPNFAFGRLVASLRVRRADRGPWDLRSLRSLHSSGEPVRGRTVLDLWRELSAYGLPKTALHTAWGMTEVCFATCSHRLLAELDHDPKRVPSVGRPIPGVSLRIVDEAGRPEVDGVVGQLQVRGPAVGRYLGEGESEQAFDENGWLNTGDLGLLVDGVLTVTGRVRNLVLVHGRKHSPLQLEATLESIPGVAPGTAVVSSVENGDGEVLGVAFFFTPEFDQAEEVLRLVHECRERIAWLHGLTIRWFIPLDAEAIPRSPVGKIQRCLLVERWHAGQLTVSQEWPFDLQGWPFDLQGKTADSPTPARADTSSDGLADQVASALALALGGRAVGSSENFFAAGGDSVRVMEAIAKLRERFPAVALLPVDLYRCPTADALAKRIVGPAATSSGVADRFEPGVADRSEPGVADRSGDPHRRRRRQRRLAAARTRLESEEE